jgi:hypothetical protein
MKIIPFRIVILIIMAGCLACMTGFPLLGAPEVAARTDAAGTWIGPGIHGGFFRLELYPDGTGYFTTQFEHSRSKTKPDVYRVLNWKHQSGFRTDQVSFSNLDITVVPVDPATVPIKFKKLEFYGGKEAQTAGGRWIDVIDMFHGDSESSDRADWTHNFRLYDEREWKNAGDLAEKAVQREKKRAK